MISVDELKTLLRDLNLKTVAQLKEIIVKQTVFHVKDYVFRKPANERTISVEVISEVNCVGWCLLLFHFVQYHL